MDSPAKPDQFSRPDPRHGPRERYCAQHDRHDRRGAVHHHAAGPGRDGRAAGHAGLGGGRAVGGVRRAGVGGTGRRVPGVGRIVSLPERDLWAEKMGTADFVFVYLATFLQRSAFDRQRMHRAGRLRCLLLARSRDGVCRAHLGSAHPVGRVTSSELDCDTGNCTGDRHLLIHGLAALPAHHSDRATFENAVAWRDGNDWMDHLCRADALQRRSRI